MGGEGDAAQGARGAAPPPGVAGPRARGSPLKGEVLRLKAELREAEEARAGLLARCGELGEEREAVRAKLRSAVRKGKKIEGEKLALEAAAAEAAAAVRVDGGAEQRAADAEQALEEARRELRELRERPLPHTAPAPPARGDSEAAAEEARDLRRELDVMRAAMQAAAERVAGTAEAEAAAKLGEEALKEDAGRLRQRVAELEGRLAAAEAGEAQNEALAAELGRARRAGVEQEGRVGRLEDEVAGLRGELKAAEAEGERLRAEAARQADLAAAAAASAGTALQERGEAIEARERELAEALEGARARQARAEEVETEARERAAEKEVEFARLSADAAERNKRFGHLKEVFDAKEAGFAVHAQELKDSVADAERRAVAAEREAVERRDAAGAAELLTKAAEARLLDVQKSVDMVVEEVKDAHRTRSAALEEELRESKGRAGELEEAVSRLEAKLAAAAAMAPDLRPEQRGSEREGLQEELQEAQARERDARALVTTLEQRCELLGEQVQLLEAQAPGGGDEMGDLEEGAERPGSSAAEELRSLRDRAAGFEKQEAQYQNRIAALESKNQELGWQVAMVAGGGGAGGGGGGAGGLAAGKFSTARPGGVLDPKGPRKGGVPGLLGAALRYRFHILGGYLLVLHALVYFALTHGVFKRHAERGGG